MGQFHIHGNLSKCLNGLIVSDINSDLEQAGRPDTQNVQQQLLCPMKKAQQAHLEVGSVIRKSVAVIVTAQPWYFADRLLITVRHMKPCWALQHTTYKQYVTKKTYPVLKNQAIKMYGGMDIKIHAFSTSVVVRNEWSRSCFRHFNSGERTQVIHLIHVCVNPTAALMLS